MQKSDFYVITIDYVLSPRTFYSLFLKELQKYFRWMADGKSYSKVLCIDLLKCSKIEGSVIPNLLVIGHIVKLNTECLPCLFVEKGSALSAFLLQIGFYDTNDYQHIFEVNVDRGEEESRYRLADYCTTIFLSASLTEVQVASTFARNYIDLFQLECLDQFTYMVQSDGMLMPVNLMEVFGKQICYNSILHGKSFCYVTMQVNKSMERVMMSFADCGSGLYASFYKKVQDESYQPLKLPFSVSDTVTASRHRLDLMAILDCVVYRFHSIYGMWFVLRDVMNAKGTIRIHSGKARVILNDISVESLENCQTRQEAGELLYDHLLRGIDVIQETPHYKGTHIEIELPLKK